MKRLMLTVAAVLVATSAQAGGAITGQYVEARTAEVFAGGCIMSSEAETIGRQAVLAWRIDAGVWEGQTLDGLAVVAAVSGDRNLGVREIGGEAPSYVRAQIFVDERATPAQQQALARLAQELSRGLMTEIVEVTPVPVRFARENGTIQVAAGEARLEVQTAVAHKPGCGAMKWFTPFSSVQQPRLGLTTAHSFSGETLDTRWSAPNRKSAFHGTFSYTPLASLSN